MNPNTQLIGLLSAYYILAIVIEICCMWRIFRKAGQPGWAAIIPIYNFVVWLKIIEKPMIWILLLFIPFVNIVISIMMVNQLALKFGRTTGFTVGMLFLAPIFYPILAYSDYEYTGTPEDPSTVPDTSEEKRSRFVMAAVILLTVNGLIHAIMSIVGWSRMMGGGGGFAGIFGTTTTLLFYLGIFMIAISVHKKYRTATIILFNLILLFSVISTILPAMMMSY